MGNVKEVPYCTICKLVCENPNELDAFKAHHNNTPITGPKFIPGELFTNKFAKEYEQQKGLGVILVTSEQTPSADHERLYGMMGFRIKNSSRPDRDRYLDPHYDYRDLLELTEAEFNKAVQIMKNDKYLKREELRRGILNKD